MKASIKLRRGLDGEVTTLNASAMLGVGGEATVYSFPHDESLAAKVYLVPTDEHARKLAVMCAHPPVEAVPSENELPLAWPVDLLRSANRARRVVGYLMPRMRGMTPIIDVYTPQARLRHRPQFTYKHMLRTGQNLTRAVSGVHASNYVIGDLNYTNVFVSEDAQVTLIDTDSFQVTDPDSGKIYHCPVFTPDFTPPELQGEVSPSVDRTIEQDLFGLGVLLFLLLMGGSHPFTGRFEEEGDPPPVAERIRDGHFPYSLRRQVPYQPTPVALPFGLLAPGLRDLFVQCFEDGHDDPGMRPSAKVWQEALVEAEQDMIDCASNQQHKYGGHLSSCPWCERTIQLGGRDPFPSQQAVDSGHHLQPVEVRQTLPQDWSPEWQSQQQTRQYTAAKSRLTPDSKFWVGLGLILWLGIPAWGVATFVSLELGLLAIFVYGIMAMILPWGLLSAVGWRRAVRFDAGNRWLSISTAGSIVGVILLFLIFVLALL